MRFLMFLVSSCLLSVGLGRHSLSSRLIIYLLEQISYNASFCVYARVAVKVELYVLTNC
jgi:hypothetical protein